MKILRKLSEEKGSITMTVVALMLFITTGIFIAYFSLSNQSNDQSKKTRQVADSYKVTNSDLIQKYKDVLENLNEVTTMSIAEVKSLGNTMLSKEKNTIVNDELGNNFIVPAGFKVTDDANNVTEGVVIQDKDGNEFVWIPVGEIRYEQNGIIKTKTIELRRYEFKVSNDSTAGTIVQSKTDGSALRPTGFSYDFIEEAKTSTGKGTYGNAIAKDIEEFKLKTNEARGFWIGRYEARIEGYTGNVITTNSNNETSWTGYTGGKLVEKPGAQVFNYITQNKASELSIAMYPENQNFQSDLCNSYAWDTATLFLQEYDNRTDEVKSNSAYNMNYSNQKPLSSWFKNRGTNDLKLEEKIRDKICNVYDMADNCFEWITESFNLDSYPCTKRGGESNSEVYYVNSRTNSRTISNSAGYSFRPILYLK